MTYNTLNSRSNSDNFAQFVFESLTLAGITEDSTAFDRDSGVNLY